MNKWCLLERPKLSLALIPEFALSMLGKEKKIELNGKAWLASTLSTRKLYFSVRAIFIFKAFITPIPVYPFFPTPLFPHTSSMSLTKISFKIKRQTVLTEAPSE